jgi:sortase family protein
MSTRTRRTRILGAAGAVLLAVGVITIVVAVRAQQSAPQPPRSAAVAVSVIPSAISTTTAAKQSSTSAAPTPTTHGAILARSVPVHLSVPAIGVESDLLQIGLNAAGAIQTPPLVRDSHAYWLTVSPTPGQLGPATIIGHVDSAAYGPGVFFRLGALRQRDTISVTRADAVVAVFGVERVVVYPKAQFPTFAVYGNTDNAALRLITCGGIFDPNVHSYESNIVAYASLVATHRA